jgi:murein DD-endopeptidase MepM/ murein hydrolase activator NlpD
MLIESHNDPERLLKILHLNPSVQENDHVRIGDCIGTYLRSGYFHRWTDPHMHIEVRHRTDPIRARGGLPIHLINDIKSRTFSLCQDQKISGKLSLVTDEYVLVEMDSPLPKLGNYSGLVASIGNVQGILDCGIPHYKFGGLHLPCISRRVLPDTMKINSKTVGLVSKNLESGVLFKSVKTKIEICGVPILGLSLNLHVGESRIIKAIPIDPSTFPFVENDSVVITFRGADLEN